MEPSVPQVPKPEARASILFLLVIVAALVLLAVQIYHFFPFIADDAFISLRYSQRLIQGKGLTWSDSQRVEGYTNLLWVLFCAGLGAIGMDLVLAARLLGILSALAALAAIALYIRVSLPPRRRPLAAACSLIPFALSSPIAVWAIGGLEQTFLIALLAWALVDISLFFQNGRSALLLWASLLLAGVTLTRADGFVFPILLFAGLVIAQRLRHAPLVPALLVLPAPAAAYLAQLVFRLAYYKEWLPNTAYVKVSFTVHRFATGLRYVAAASKQEAALGLLAVIGCIYLWRDASRRCAAVVFLVTAIGFSGYLILIGGDIFPSARHFLPVILILSFAAVHASFIADRPRGGVSTPWTIALVSIALLAVLSRHQAIMAIVERWEWRNKQLGLYIHDHFPADAILVSDAAGATPFYSQLEAIDPLGLNDHHIAHLNSAGKGKGRIGHELGDGKYVLDHDPAIILFGESGQAPPSLYSDFLIVQDPRFRQNYELQHWAFDKPTPWVSEVYVRRSPATKINNPVR
jgi:hypothetical protein